MDTEKTNDEMVQQDVCTGESGEKTLLDWFNEFREMGFSKTAAMTLAKDKVRRIDRAEREAKKSDLEERREENIVSLAGDDDEDGGDKRWVDHIRVNRDNVPLYIYGNTFNFVKYYPKFADKFEKNLFTYDIELDRVPVNDEVMSHIRHCVNMHLFNVKREWIDDAVTVEACKRQYHPVKDVIESLEWDGVPRVEEFFIYRLGAENTPLTRELTAKWMYAMLLRIYEPGCYFDHYLIICDRKGGTGKTKTFERITECLHANVEFPLTPIVKDITNDQNNVLMLQRSILGLFDEAEGIKYSNLERFKSFVTTNKFTARLPYMRKPTTLNIHTVFAMNTNDEAFLTDNTTDYERRAWVIPCDGKQDMGDDYWEPRNNDDTLRQVWAELLHWYRHPETAPFDTGKYNFVSKQNEDALKEIQRMKKTSTLDVELYNTVSSIFTNRYSKEMFQNERDFLTDFRHSKRGLDEDDYDTELNVIPCDWLISVAQKSVTGKRGTETVKNMVKRVVDDKSAGDWQLDLKHRYGSKTMPCWVRVSSVSHDDKPAKRIDLWNNNDINLPR